MWETIKGVSNAPTDFPSSVADFHFSIEAITHLLRIFNLAGKLGTRLSFYEV